MMSLEIIKIMEMMEYLLQFQCGKHPFVIDQLCISQINQFFTPETVSYTSLLSQIISHILKSNKNVTFHIWPYPKLTPYYRVNQRKIVINQADLKGNTFQRLIAKSRSGGLYL